MRSIYKIKTKCRFKQTYKFTIPELKEARVTYCPECRNPAFIVTTVPSLKNNNYSLHSIGKWTPNELRQGKQAPNKCWWCEHSIRHTKISELRSCSVPSSTREIIVDLESKYNYEV